MKFFPSERIGLRLPPLFAPLLFFLFPALSAVAQQRVEGELTVEGESRSYSLYIPSGYDPLRPNGVMYAMHPLNTARWNSRSWCDTLTAFAEAGGLILVCPDGGADGNVISQRVDTLAATALFDSVRARYNTDPLRVYVMGFSVGGLAAYLYGLANADRFAGVIPIGAAINGTGEIGPLLDRARQKPVYVIHGEQDAAQTRYYPAVAALEQNGALLRTLLMPGVGHTIDFPNRNRILSDAFRWVDSVNLARIASGVEEKEGRKNERNDAGAFVRPNPVPREGEGTFGWPDDFPAARVRVIDLLGNVREEGGVTLIDRTSAKIFPGNLSPGVYFLETVGREGRRLLRFVVR